MLTSLAGPVVKLLLLPPGGIIVLLAAGLLTWRRRPRAGGVLCGAALALLYLLSTGAGSWLLVRPLESLEPAFAGAGRAEAIVVLTAGRVRHSPDYSGVPVPDFVALERITYAAHVYRATRLPVLVSGGLASDSAREEPLALSMQRVLVNEFQIPVRWSEITSRTTAENARFSAAMLAAAGVRRIILVTDAVHMRRARRAFEQYGLQVTPGPTFYLEPGQFDPLRLLPTIENLRRSHAALYEWCGLALYALRGS